MPSNKIKPDTPIQRKRRIYPSDTSLLIINLIQFWRDEKLIHVIVLCYYFPIIIYTCKYIETNMKFWNFSINLFVILFLFMVIKFIVIFFRIKSWYLHLIHNYRFWPLMFNDSYYVLRCSHFSIMYIVTIRTIVKSFIRIA